MTFDVVGHLLLHRCIGTHGTKYPDEWFDFDPGTCEAEDPLFYAPDLVAAIADTQIDHEICTHTFSHIPCNDVSKSIIRKEIEMVRQLHKKQDIPLTDSLVTPWNHEPPMDLLREMGIKTLRVTNDNYPKRGSKVEKFLWYLTREPPTRPPKTVDGVTNIYTSTGISLAAYYLPQGGRDPHPVFRIIPKSIRCRLHQRYLSRALELVIEGHDVHLWAHLYDLANEDQLSLVQTFLKDAGEAAAAGDIEILTLGEHGHSVREGESG